VPGGINIIKMALVLHYRGMGEVYLMDNSGACRISMISNIDSLMSESLSDEDQKLIRVLLGNDWIDMSQKLSVARKHAYSSLVYDIASERLIQSHLTSSAYEQKMLAYLSRFIGSSNDLRYLPILQEVKNSSAHRAIKRHANRAIGDIGSSVKIVDEEPKAYARGDIDIGVFGSR